MGCYTTTSDRDIICALVDASKAAASALLPATVAVEPRKPSTATAVGVFEPLKSSPQIKMETDSATESETESEIDSDSDSDCDCASESESLASSGELAVAVSALASLYIMKEDASDLASAHDDEEASKDAVETQDVPALLARIAELEADNSRLKDERNECRDVAIEFGDQYSIAETRIAELEAEINEYDHHYAIAEARITELEAEISNYDHHYAIAKARIAELEADITRLKAERSECLDIAIGFDEQYAIAEARITELEAGINNYDHHYAIAKARIAELDAEIEKVTSGFATAAGVTYPRGDSVAIVTATTKKAVRSAKRVAPLLPKHSTSQS